MQCPIRCPYNGLNLMFPMGALPIEKGAIMKSLCRPYVTVSQRVMPFPVGKMGCSAVRKHDECPNRCPQWIICDAPRGSALKRWVQSCNNDEIRIKVSPLTASNVLACLAERENRGREREGQRERERERERERWTDRDRDRQRLEQHRSDSLNPSVQL